MVILLLACGFCSDSSIAKAADPKITPLRAGDTAPFEGDLYPVETSISFGIQLETCRERAVIDLDHALERHELRLRRCKSIAGVRSDADKRRIDLLRAELDRQLQWYMEPTFIIVVTVVTTVAALIGAAYLLDVTLGWR